jgi:hypothetical protein
MGLAVAIAGCGGDKKDSDAKAAEAQRAIQEGMQKEAADQKEETKK